MALVVLAMSGGVDSSVAAQLLLSDGHEVVGVFMRHGVESPLAACGTGATGPLPILPSGGGRLDHKQGCCSASDAEDARQVAEQLDIPFYALNLQKEFDRIIDYFVDEYGAGRTPNPCVMCNNWIKFGKLFAYADSIGADYVATGHYARLQATASRPRLLRGVDESKDQSYVLFGIEAALLPRMLLPVGEYTKPVIREMAQSLSLRVAEKRDSQEICFVTSGKHGEFVAARSQCDTAGEIVTVQGEVVGQHPGIENFTIGQRKGLGVALGEPFFVVAIDATTRQVTIGRHEDLAAAGLTACRANWLVPVLEDRFRCEVQIRYNSRAYPAEVERLSDGRFAVQFDRPCHGVAPGQAVVCYAGPLVLGGGWIESSAREFVPPVSKPG